VARQIPSDFDINSQDDLDCSETLIRDVLKLQVANWIRFRYAIHVGIEAVHLTSSGTIPEEVKEAYRELGKSHYEVIISLGCSKIALIGILESWRNPLLLRKCLKEFYFHVGCLLDNLARLIYIVNDPNSASAKYQGGKRRGYFVRHWVDWGELPDYPGYRRLKRHKPLFEIRNIRNSLTHSWPCPIYYDKETGQPIWPLAVRKQRDFLWPFDELPAVRRRYRGRRFLLEMMQGDFACVEKLQQDVFGKLVRDIRKFETNYAVKIQ